MKKLVLLALCMTVCLHAGHKGKGRRKKRTAARRALTRTPRLKQPTKPESASSLYQKAATAQNEGRYKDAHHLYASLFSSDEILQNKTHPHGVQARLNVSEMFLEEADTSENPESLRKRAACFLEPLTDRFLDMHPSMRKHYWDLYARLKTGQPNAELQALLNGISESSSPTIASDLYETERPKGSRPPVYLPLQLKNFDTQPLPATVIKLSRILSNPLTEEQDTIIKTVLSKFSEKESMRFSDHERTRFIAEICQRGHQYTADSWANKQDAFNHYLTIAHPSTLSSSHATSSSSSASHTAQQREASRILAYLLMQDPSLIEQSPLPTLQQKTMMKQILAQAHTAGSPYPSYLQAMQKTTNHTRQQALERLLANPDPKTRSLARASLIELKNPTISVLPLIQSILTHLPEHIDDHANVLKALCKPNIDTQIIMLKRCAQDVSNPMAAKTAHGALLYLGLQSDNTAVYNEVLEAIKKTPDLLDVVPFLFAKDAQNEQRVWQLVSQIDSSDYIEKTYSPSYRLYELCDDKQSEQAYRYLKQAVSHGYQPACEACYQSLSTDIPTRYYQLRDLVNQDYQPAFDALYQHAIEILNVNPEIPYAHTALALIKKALSKESTLTLVEALTPTKLKDIQESKATIEQAIEDLKLLAQKGNPKALVACAYHLQEDFGRRIKKLEAYRKSDNKELVAQAVLRLMQAYDYEINQLKAAKGRSWKRLVALYEKKKKAIRAHRDHHKLYVEALLQESSRLQLIYSGTASPSSIIGDIPQLEKTHIAYQKFDQFRQSLSSGPDTLPSPDELAKKMSLLSSVYKEMETEFPLALSGATSASRASSSSSKPTDMEDLDFDTALAVWKENPSADETPYLTLFSTLAKEHPEKASTTLATYKAKAKTPIDHLAVGHLHRIQGQTDAALASYAQASTEPEALYGIADLMHSKAKSIKETSPDEARKTLLAAQTKLLEALAIKPDHQHALFTMGLILHELGSSTQSAEYIKKAANLGNLDAMHVTAHNLHYGIGCKPQPEEEKKLYEKIAAECPKRREYAQTMAQLATYQTEKYWEIPLPEYAHSLLTKAETYESHTSYSASKNPLIEKLRWYQKATNWPKVFAKGQDTVKKTKESLEKYCSHANPNIQQNAQLALASMHLSQASSDPEHYFKAALLLNHTQMPEHQDPSSIDPQQWVQFYRICSELASSFGQSYQSSYQPPFVLQAIDQLCFRALGTGATSLDALGIAYVAAAKQKVEAFLEHEDKKIRQEAAMALTHMNHLYAQKTRGNLSKILELQALKSLEPFVTEEGSKEKIAQSMMRIYARYSEQCIHLLQKQPYDAEDEHLRSLAMRAQLISSVLLDQGNTENYHYGSALAHTVYLSAWVDKDAQAVEQKLSVARTIKSAEAFYLAGQASLQRTLNIEKARSLYLEALEQDPKHIPSLKMLTKIDYLSGNTESFSNDQKRFIQLYILALKETACMRKDKDLTIAETKAVLDRTPWPTQKLDSTH